MQFEKPRAELEVNEKMFLAENMLQLHFAEFGEHESADINDALEESSADFRTWFSSPDGKAIIHDYAIKHERFQIEAYTDMELLERLYVEYRDRTLH